MYRVLLVDDEKFIRKSIRNRIDWEKYGFVVEAEAGNGEEALSLLEEIRPELVLVDIRMPVMDGLAFITEAKRKLPGSSYVIMSAYNDWEYAKKAIRLGVEDYILKPVEEEEMEKILAVIMQRLDKEKIARQIKRTGKESGGPSLRAKLTAAIAFWDETGDLEQGITQSIRQNTFVSEQGWKVYDIEEYSREGCYLYLLNGDSLSETGIRSLLGQVLEQIAPKVYGEAGIKAAGSEVLDRADVRKAVSECIKALKGKMFFPERRIVYCSSFDREKEKNEKYREIREKIISAQRSFLKKEYQKSMQEFIAIVDKTIQPGNTAMLVEEMIHESLTMLRHFAESQSIGAEFDIMFNRFQSRDYLLLYRTAEELRENLKEMFGKFMDLYGNEENKDIVESVKDYIQENYAENINVADMAERFHTNANYLSTLFRKKTGVKLVNYIEGIRMEKAKEYLRNDVWTVTEIALETGYSDSNYFSKVFKRYAGVGPKQFREMEQGKE